MHQGYYLLNTDCNWILQENIKKCETTVQELEKRQEHQRNIWLEAIRKNKEVNNQEKPYDMLSLIHI